MNHLLIAATVTLALATILSLYRVFRGPTVFDRLTGLGLIGTKTVVILVLLGFLTRRLDMFVDIGLAYGLIGFIGAFQDFILGLQPTPASLRSCLAAAARRG